MSSGKTRSLPPAAQPNRRPDDDPLAELERIVTEGRIAATTRLVRGEPLASDARIAPTPAAKPSTPPIRPQPAAPAFVEDEEAESAFAGTALDPAGTANGLGEHWPDELQADDRPERISHEIEPGAAAPSPAFLAALAVQPQGPALGMKVAASLLGIMVFSGVGFLSWRAFSTPAGAETPPIIRADGKPVKVMAEKPPEPAAAKPEAPKLVTRQEEPVDRIAPPLGLKTAATLAGDGPDAALKKVKTVVVRPDGSIVDDASRPSLPGLPPAGLRSEVAPVAATVAPQVTGSTPAPIAPAVEATRAAPRFPLPDAAPGVPAAVAPIRPTDTPASAPQRVARPEPAKTEAPSTPASAPRPAPQAAAPAMPRAAKPATGAPLALAAAAPAAATPAPFPPQAPAPATRTAALPPTAPAAAPGGGSVVQLAAATSEDAARDTFASLQRKHPAALAGKSAVIRRAEIPGKGTVYRLSVGPLSGDEAARLCATLKSQGSNCFTR